jgi:hypothetical protein
MPKQPEDHVKQHLAKTGVDPAQLSDGTIEVLNTFTEVELVKVHELGGELQKDPNLSPDQKVSALH